MHETPSFLDQTATAEILGLSPRTLEKMRVEGRGPKFRKFGSRVLYELSDLIEWADDRTYNSTSDTGDGEAA